MKKITIFLISITVIFTAIIPVSASGYDYSNGTRDSLVYDFADRLSDNEESDLLEELENISTEIQCEIAFITVTSTNGKTIKAFSEDFFTEYGFGYNDTNDAIILVIDAIGREYHITTKGFGTDALNSESDFDSIKDSFSSSLSSGDYYSAGISFAKACKKAINQYDKENNNNSLFSFKTIIISVVIGLIIGLIYTFMLKSQLKSVAKKTTANDYVIPGSLQITQHNDVFLYSNVAKTPIPKAKSSSGSSSGRGSSSGFGGSSGKF